MPSFDEKNVLPHIRAFVKHGLYDSAELLHSPSAPGPSTELLSMAATVSLRQDQPMRALSYAQTALVRMGKDKSNSAQGQRTMTDLKLIQCKGLVSLGRLKDAADLLESIPPSQRNLAVLAYGASLYKKQLRQPEYEVYALSPLTVIADRQNRKAITWYKQLMKKNPMALEAPLALADLGVAGPTILSAFPNHEGVSSSVPIPPAIETTPAPSKRAKQLDGEPQQEQQHQQTSVLSTSDANLQVEETPRVESRSKKGRGVADTPADTPLKETRQLPFRRSTRLARVRGHAQSHDAPPRPPSPPLSAHPTPLSGAAHPTPLAGAAHQTPLSGIDVAQSRAAARSMATGIAPTPLAPKKQKLVTGKVSSSPMKWIDTLILARAHLVRSHIDRALSCFTALDRAFKGRCAHLIEFLALCHHQRQHHELARTYFGKLQRLHPGYLGSLDVYMIGYGIEDATGCQRILRQLLSTHSTRPEVLTATAAFCVRMNETDRALQLCNRALAVSSMHAEALVVMGNIYLQLERFAVATGAFSLALEAPIKPLNAFRENMLKSFTGLVRALLSTADIYESQRSPNKAARTRREALHVSQRCMKVFPDNPHSFALVGISQLRSGYPLDEVRTILEKAMEKAAVDPCCDATLAMAELLVREEKHDEAITLLKKELTRSPLNAADLYVHIANALAFQKRKDEAAYYYREALKLKPNALAEEGLQQLQQGGQEDDDYEADDVDYLETDRAPSDGEYDL